MLATVGFGWAKPVMVNSRALKHPKRDMAIIALAGPVSNFIFAGILWIVSQFLPQNIIYVFVYLTMRLNIGLGLFNLIPFPPLDGSKVLMSFLPDKYYYKVMKYERFGVIILIIGLLIWNNLPSILRTLTSTGLWR